MRAALDLGVAVFASEWGTSEATGDGGPTRGRCEEWLAFLDRHTISWVNWSLCDKSETSAALKSLAGRSRRGQAALVARDSLLVPETVGLEGYPLWAARELSPSGSFVRMQMRRPAGPRPPR